MEYSTYVNYCRLMHAAVYVLSVKLNNGNLMNTIIIIVPTWTSWGSWSGCSRSCGGGRYNRERQCINGTTCPGSGIQFHNCNMEPCNPSSMWSRWSDWSTCTKTCKGGCHIRTRKCVNKQHGTVTTSSDCVGDSKMFGSCNNGIPCNRIPSSKCNPK